jgi:dienelactone hydrolase
MGRPLLFAALILAMTSRAAFAQTCTMPPGTVAQYAGPGSHVDAKICHDAATGKDDACNLNGWLYKPASGAYHRAIVFIHGSGKRKNMASFCSMVNAFVKAGYVVWVPYLRGYVDDTHPIAGHVDGVAAPTTKCKDSDDGKEKLAYFCNSGVYVGDDPKESSAAGTVAIMQREVDSEISWAFAYLEGLPASGGPLVDPGKIVLMGHSFGGITVNVAADRTAVPAALVDLSGGVLSWPGDPQGWAKLLGAPAAKRSKPIVFVQTLNESSYYYSHSGDPAASSVSLVESASNGPAARGGASMLVFSAVPNLDVNGPWCSPGDDHSGDLHNCAHTTFVMDPREVARWMPHVLDFIDLALH